MDDSKMRSSCWTFSRWLLVNMLAGSLL